MAKFLQVSDLHLGAPFGWLPPEQRELRRREQQRALEECVRQAIERGAHAVLIAGDLFDRDGVDAESLAFAVHAFDVAGCPPVFIAPGNHDPWSESSHAWSPRLLQARGWSWPEHVHVFSTAGWSGRPLPDLPLEVWGRCFSAGIASAARPLEPAAVSAVSAAPEAVAVAVFHGSLEGHCPPGQVVTAPFSGEEAQQAPFAYLAVGHYHRATRIEKRSGAALQGVRLAYAGSAVALDPTEVGAHGALEVRIDFDTPPPRVETNFVPLDPRRVYDLSVEISGLSSADQIDRRIAQALDEARVSEQDIATVRLSGRLVKGVRYGGPGLGLRDRAFHIRTDLKGVRPDYDLATFRRDPPSTTEERFVQALVERLESESDPEQRAIVEGALYYGLDAFRLREVSPAYEEIGE